jgi:hypothetical protein
MPLSREQLSSVKRLLKEARNLVADAVRTLERTSPADPIDADLTGRLRRAGREIGSIQDSLESQA